MSLLKSKKSSSAWFHYVSVDDGKKARCNHCDRTVVVSNGSTGNLFRHMRLKHSSIPLSKQRSRHNAQIVPNQINYVVAAAESNKPAEEMVRTTLEIQHVTSTNVVKFNNIPETPSEQPTSFYLIQPYDEIKRQELDRQLLRVIVKELLPFDIVEGREFIKFINMLNSNYVLPSCKNLSNDVLIQMHQDAMEELKSTLKDVTSVALTTDRWTSKSGDSFIAFTAHYLNKDLELKASFLECFSYQEQNAIHIALLLQELVVHWELSNKILAIITDGSDFMIKAVVSCQWNHITCFAHMLNKLVEAGLTDIDPFVSKVRNIVQYFKRNSMVLNKFHLTQNRMGLSNSKLKNDVQSRWDTTFEMLTRFFKNKVPVLSTIEQLQLDSFQLTSADFIYLENVIKILTIFNSIKVEMCSEKTVSLSKIPHMIRFMGKQLTNILRSTELHPDIVKMGNTLKDRFKEFETLEMNEIVCQSVLLDPRFKKRGFPDTFFEQACMSLRNDVITMRQELIKKKTENICIVSEFEENNSESEYFMDIWSELDTKNPAPQQNPTKVASVELDAFLNDSYVPMESNPLSYWANISNQNKFPALFELAKQLLCIPAASVPCQKMYSKAGNVFMKKRNCLPLTKVDKILFLQQNL